MEPTVEHRGGDDSPIIALIRPSTPVNKTTQHELDDPDLKTAFVSPNSDELLAARQRRKSEAQITRSVLIAREDLSVSSKHAKQPSSSHLNIALLIRSLLLGIIIDCLYRNLP